MISLDPNIRPTVIKDKKKASWRGIKRLIAKADLVKTSDEDVDYMTGKQDFAKTAKAWLKLGAKIVAITRGGEGLLRCSPRKHSLSLPAPKVKVADTVGAGDTFTAGFLTYLEPQCIAEQESDGKYRGNAADACSRIRHEMCRCNGLAPRRQSAMGK